MNSILCYQNLCSSNFLFSRNDVQYLLWLFSKTSFFGYIWAFHFFFWISSSVCCFWSLCNSFWDEDHLLMRACTFDILSFEFTEIKRFNALTLFIVVLLLLVAICLLLFLFNFYMFISSAISTYIIARNTVICQLLRSILIRCFFLFPILRFLVLLLFLIFWVLLLSRIRLPV